MRLTRADSTGQLFRFLLPLAEHHFLPGLPYQRHGCGTSRRVWSARPRWLGYRNHLKAPIISAVCHSCPSLLSEPSPIVSSAICHAATFRTRPASPTRLIDAGGMTLPRPWVVFHRRGGKPLVSFTSPCQVEWRARNTTARRTPGDDRVETTRNFTPLSLSLSFSPPLPLSHAKTAQFRHIDGGAQASVGTKRNDWGRGIHDMASRTLRAGNPIKRIMAPFQGLLLLFWRRMKISSLHIGPTCTSYCFQFPSSAITGNSFRPFPAMICTSSPPYCPVGNCPFQLGKSLSMLQLIDHILWLSFFFVLIAVRLILFNFFFKKYYLQFFFVCCDLSGSLATKWLKAAPSIWWIPYRLSIKLLTKCCGVTAEIKPRTRNRPKLVMQPQPWP